VTASDGTSGRPSGPVDSLVDLVFYAPLGLVFLAREELPKLAARGRDQFRTQSDLARMVGQLAVAQGRRKVDSVVDRLAGRSDEPAPHPPGVAPFRSRREPEPPGRPVAVRDLSADERLPVPTGEVVPDVPATNDVEVAPEVAPAPAPSLPSAADLPIPGYDSLSASQVVQRLAGLSAEELEAVRAYEQAGRARKTVLLRVAQLRAAS
jgi:hypothetical protein